MEPPAPPVEGVASAKAAAHDLLAVTRQQGSQAQFRNGFVARANSAEPVPAATELLRRSNKSGLPLRLALTYFWLAGSRVDARPPSASYTVTVPLRTLTRMMTLDPSSAGHRRRIRENTMALADLGLVEVDIIGDELTVALRSEFVFDHTDRPYFRPGTRTDGWDPRVDAYFTLGSRVFTDVWVSFLSPSALVVLLSFRYLVQTRGTASSNVQGLFINETMRKERFGFSERTYYAGSTELERFGIAKSWRQHLRAPIAPGPIKVRRVFSIERGLVEGYTRLDFPPTAGAGNVF